MWDERYSAPDFLFGAEPAAFLLDHANYLKRGDRALAVADGEGRNSVFMAERGLQVTAIDASEVGLDKARGLAAARGVSVRYQLADLDAYDWQQAQYDLVVAIFIQFAAPDFRARIFEGLVQSLTPGGILMLHGYTPKQLEYGTGGPPYADNMYTEPILRTAFGDLEILHLETYEREINEGSGHAGMSALIDLIARSPGDTRADS